MGLMSPMPEGAPHSGRGRGLVDDRHDGPRDQVPVLAQADGYDRLDVENVCGGVVGADAEVEVVLERHADQVGDRVLRVLGQRFLAFLGIAPAAAAGGLAGSRRQGERVVEGVFPAVIRTARVADGLAVEVEVDRERGQQW